MLIALKSKLLEVHVLKPLYIDPEVGRSRRPSQFECEGGRMAANGDENSMLGSM